MIKIYTLNNEVAGWIDLSNSELDTLSSAIQYDGSFELDITLADDETLGNINVANQTADVITIPVPSESDILAAQARQKRDQLLVQLDTLVSNPLRWSSFTQEQQTAYATYRQALLDVPQQSGFPTTINWPIKP